MLLVSVSPREHNLGITSLVTSNIDALLFWLESMYDPLNISRCHPPARHIPTHGRLCALKPVYELPRPVWSRTVRAEWNQSGYCVGSEKKEDLQGLLCPAATRTVLFSGETRGTAGPQPPPVVLGCPTVGPLPKEGVKQSLSVVARCLVKGLVKAKLGDGADAMKASCLRGRAERERAARGHYRARSLTFRRGEWSEARQHGGAVQLIDGLYTQCEYSLTMSNLKEYGCQRERMAAKRVHVPPSSI